MELLPAGPSQEVVGGTPDGILVGSTWPNASEVHIGGVQVHVSKPVQRGNSHSRGPSQPCGAVHIHTAMLAAGPLESSHRCWQCCAEGVRVKVHCWGANELNSVLGSSVGKFTEVHSPVLQVSVLLEIEDGSDIVLIRQMGHVGCGAWLAADNDIFANIMIVEACERRGNW